MARLPRLSLNGFVHYVSQRASGGQILFRDEADCRTMLAILGDLGRERAIDLHAYALLPDRFDLLLTPRDPWTLGRAMQTLGRRFVRAYNDRHQRHGGLWEGRYRATLVEPGNWLLLCMRWLESAPARGLRIEDALAYPWSSLAHHVGRRVDPLVRDPEGFWQLGNTPFERQASYDRLIRQGIDAATESRIETDTRHGWPLGSAEFLAELARRVDRPLIRRAPGRPVRRGTGIPAP